MADSNHDIARVIPALAVPPVIDLSGKIARGLPGKRRVRRAEALSSFAVADGAGRDPALPISFVEKPRHGRDRQTWIGEGHRSVECRNAFTLHWSKLPGDPAHLRVAPATIRICLELPQQITRFERRETRGSGAVALPAKPVAREAGVLGAGAAATQRDQFSGLSESIAGARFDGRAGDQRNCREQGSRLNSPDHRIPPTCVGSGWFRPTPEVRRGIGLVAIATTGLTLLACKPPPEASPALPIADAARGKQAIERVGCGSCHTIQGMRWPRGAAAPELANFGSRALIAGRVPNRPDLLAAFVRNAPAVAPGTTMPAMPLTEQEARDIAAYLYEERN